jgi:CubicO group peptidase (beta-lactamase class C family)
MRLCTSFILLFFFISTAAQTKADKLNEIMNTYHRYNMFDGSVLVAENGKVIYKNAFGLANREWNIPNTTATKFMIGSVSKPLTAMLMLLQVQKGLVHLDSSLSHYLPEFKEKPAGIVTIRQLLGHVSGMPNYDITKDFFPRISRQFYKREDYIKVYIDSALAFKPGTAHYYSSWGYYTLGFVMERVTGKSYAQLMKEELLDKLQMNSTGSYYHKQVIPNRATGYDYSLEGYTSADFRDQSNTMGTGDLYSTVEDLFKFHLALTNHTLLNKELTTQMFTPGIKPAQYGFGWFNRFFKYTPTDSVNTNFHLGMTDGFLSFFLRIPQTNSMVVILCNSSPTDFFGIVGNLVKALYSKPVDIKEPAHKAFTKVLALQGPAKAVAEFKQMNADTSRYYTDWISMNFITEQLIALNRLEDARMVAESNAVAFPKKDLILLTLGDVYRNLNRKEDAIKYYQKALEIFPGYTEAKNRLKELGVSQ